MPAMLVLEAQEAIVVFEAYLLGMVPLTSQRLREDERERLVKSGSIFIYVEDASIKRWTDGKIWSPSRSQDGFLVYREMAKRFPPGPKNRAVKKSSKSGSALKRLVGSLTDPDDFKVGGLVKRSICIKYGGQDYRLINYCNLDEAANGRLRRVLDDPWLANIQPRVELTEGQQFTNCLNSFGVQIGSDSDMPLLQVQPAQQAEPQPVAEQPVVVEQPVVPQVIAPQVVVAEPAFDLQQLQQQQQQMLQQLQQLQQRNQQLEQQIQQLQQSQQLQPSQPLQQQHAQEEQEQQQQQPSQQQQEEQGFMQLLRQDALEQQQQEHQQQQPDVDENTLSFGDLLAKDGPELDDLEYWQQANSELRMMDPSLVTSSAEGQGVKQPEEEDWEKLFLVPGLE